MKRFRFSVAGLMLVVFLVAVAIAPLQGTSFVWVKINIYMWIASIGGMLVCLLGRLGRDD
jgi:hypothetical protein